MKAKILPLEGKYYGTRIAVEYDPNCSEMRLTVWLQRGEPSERQLVDEGYTKEQWDANELVDDGWGGKVHIRQLDSWCDHYESVDSYRLASIIAEAINNYGEKP